MCLPTFSPFLIVNKTSLSLSLSLSLTERDDPGPPAHCTRPGVTRGAGDRFGIPNPRKSGSVIGADRQRFHPSCVLLKRVPQGRTESGGIVLAANAGPRAPSGGVTLKRCCTYRPSVIYLIVNKLLSHTHTLSLSLASLSLSLSRFSSSKVPLSGHFTSSQIELATRLAARLLFCVSPLSLTPTPPPPPTPFLFKGTKLPEESILVN